MVLAAIEVLGGTGMQRGIMAWLLYALFFFDAGHVDAHACHIQVLGGTGLQRGIMAWLGDVAALAADAPPRQRSGVGRGLCLLCICTYVCVTHTHNTHTHTHTNTHTGDSATG